MLVGRKYFVVDQRLLQSRYVRLIDTLDHPEINTSY